MTHTLHHATILQPDTAVHFTRATLTSARPKALHTHDFYELFWVQNGAVRHHVQQGAVLLREGDLILMHPGQRHAVQGKGDHALIVSLCIHPDVFSGLSARHPGLLADVPDEPLPTHRGIRQLATLNQAALQLENSARDSLAAEAFLLPLLADLRARSTPPNAPAWLIHALHVANDPKVFRGGAAGLVAATGRAHAHVSRTMRAVTGHSPSEYINDIRMEYAARQLITDADPVRDIASACGVPNMAHFHKLFRARHGITPLQYRRSFQRDVVQP